jgi:phosphatidylserine/phosphatidylglycerophosphate/cardiolipin synthase-like enzyme
VQDRARAIVGSMNQDPRSRLHNTEAWIVLESPELVEDLAALFEEGTALEHAFKVEANNEGEALAWRTEEDGKSVQYDAEPMTGFWLRLVARHPRGGDSRASAVTSTTSRTLPGSASRNPWGQRPGRSVRRRAARSGAA